MSSVTTKNKIEKIKIKIKSHRETRIGFITTARSNHRMHTLKHTVVRVDSCSKHLLAAPLIVQNDEAWKGEPFRRKTTLQPSL